MSTEEELTQKITASESVDKQIETIKDEITQITTDVETLDFSHKS